jgi:hypothetical protein
MRWPGTTSSIDNDSESRIDRLESRGVQWEGEVWC